MAKSKILVETLQDVTVVTFTDSSILEALVIQQIGEEIYKLVDEQAKRKLVLDFSRVRFMSSQALGMLINLRKKCQAIKGELIFCAVQPEIQKVFKIMNLTKIFKFVPSERDALAEFGVFES